MPLDPYLGDHLPYVTFFVAVAVSTWYGGLGATLTAVRLGGLAADWFFMSPRQSLMVVGETQQVGFATYFMVSLAFVGFGQALRRARERAEAVRDDFRLQVTERERAEVALRESQATLLRAQRGAQAGLWEVELPSLKITWSPAYYELFGLAPTAEPCVATWIERVHPQDRPRVEAEFRRSIEQPGPHSVQFRIIRPDGTMRWVQRSSGYRCKPAATTRSR